MLLTYGRFCQATRPLQEGGWSPHFLAHSEILGGPATFSVADNQRRWIDAPPYPGTRKERHMWRQAGAEIYLLPLHKGQARTGNGTLRSVVSGGMAGTPHKFRVLDTDASLIRSVHPQLKRKVKATLQSIQTDPAMGKALKDELAGLRSFRIRRFRIIYRVEPGQYIEIVAIGSRRSIYEETYRLIHRGRDAQE